MTITLEQAIDEVKRVTPKTDGWWEPGDIGGGQSPVDTHICTILNAVASGYLIPASEVNAQAKQIEAARVLAGEVGRVANLLLCSGSNTAMTVALVAALAAYEESKK